MVEKRIHELLFAGAGASGICYYFLFENFALKYTSASNVGVIVSMAPMFTMIFCTIAFRNQKIKWNFIVGFVIAILGIILISFNGNKSFGLNPKGDILALIAMVMWGIYSVFVQKISMLGYGGIGVVIHKKSKIGCYCTIGQQVTIGGGNSKYPGAPVIGDHVDIGQNAQILGGIRIADHVRIGAGAVVVKDILTPGVTVVGIPGRIVSK